MAPGPFCMAEGKREKEGGEHREETDPARGAVPGPPVFGEKHKMGRWRAEFAIGTVDRIIAQNATGKLGGKPGKELGGRGKRRKKRKVE